MLKAHVCKVTDNIAPPIHNLVRLAELSGLDVDETMRNLLAEVSPFNIETRYPGMLVPPQATKKTFQVTDSGRDLIVCENAGDTFEKLGI